jgi:hypothetical protein
MAPFNTHFLIAEKIWPELPGPWQPYYGQFCFGCVAPDVDKLSPALTQRDTHFFDRTGEYDLMASHRSAEFVARQAEFLSQPFAYLQPEAQAFVLGYLCHLCVDEVSKHLWRREIWLHFKDIGPGAAFAALDELVRRRTRHYAAITAALCAVQTLNLIPIIPPADLEKMRQGVCQFARAETLEDEFLALVDMFESLTPAQRAERQQYFRAHIDHARAKVGFLKIDTLIEASLVWSYGRMVDLIEGRLPQPGYPALE